jgi:hypothetical protein
VYYIRYHVAPDRPTIGTLFDAPELRGRRGIAGAGQAPQTAREPFDSLAPLLKPLQPRLFEVYDPEQFRKVLGSLLEELGRL